jgi:hypothetical protein
MAIGRAARELGHADVASRTGLVIDEERLPEMTAQPVAQQASLEISAAAGREWNDQAYRLRRPARRRILRRHASREG